MKWDIVLTYKIIALCPLIFFPERAPFLIVSIRLSPLLGSGEIANECLKPHIETFILKAIKW